MKLRKCNKYMKKLFGGMISLFVGIAIGIIGALQFAETEYKKEKYRADCADYHAQKHLRMFLVLNDWIRMKQKGKSLSSYFEENGYKKIAVYGMGYIGNTLVQELKDTDIQVAYGIDQKADSLHGDVNIITMADPMDMVDIIVITAITSADSVKSELSQKVGYPSVSLEDILHNVLL